MLKKIKKEELDMEKVNEAVSLLDKILKIAYILIFIVAIFFLIRLCQELKIMNIIITILKILAPLFIGFFLAWLFAPIVKKLNQKGLKRGFGTAIVYIVFLGLLTILICAIVPVLKNQINDFINMIPSLFDDLKNFITNLFSNVKNTGGIDIAKMQANIFSKIEEYGTSLSKTLPEITVTTAKSFVSGLGTFVIGLIIGFYLSISFNDIGEAIITLFPTKHQKDVRELCNEMNMALRRFVNGAIIDAFFVFVITSIAFSIIGLKAPLLFGLFCGITNVIPYAGPYIGGIPAVIVGFSQGPITGILTLIAIVVIQFLEGNFLQPVIMSKTTKLHPVTIIVGLLLFGHFFGIIGMVISTPIIAVIKSIFMFFKDKYDLKLFENI